MATVKRGWHNSTTGESGVVRADDAKTAGKAAKEKSAAQKKK